MAQLAAIPQTGGLGSIAQLIQQLAPIFLGSGATDKSESGTTTTGGTNVQTSATAPDIQAAIQQLLGQVQGNAGQFSKEAAIADSSGAINTQILDAIRANMPSVLGGQKQAGMYNDTTTSLLTNDLMARIAGEASKAQTGAIAQYGQLANQNNTIASNLLNGLAQANKTQATTQQQTQQQQATSTQKTQPIVSPAATGGIAGLIGAIGALKNGKDLLSGAQKLFGGTNPSAADAINPNAFDSFTPSMLTGGSMAGSMDADVLAGMSSDIPNIASSFGSIGAFDPSGLNFGTASDLTNSVGDAASQIGNYAGVSNDLSGVFTGASDSLGDIGSAVGAGSDLASSASDGADFFGSLADLGKKFTDTLGDYGSSIGDFFGGFFADGGLVGKDPRASLISNFEVNKLPPDARLLALAQQFAKQYADGGIVEDTPKNALRGRAGGKSYTDEATTAQANGGFGNLQRIRALWENIANPAALVSTAAPSVIAGNEDALVGAGGRSSADMMPAIRAVLDPTGEGPQGRALAQRQNDMIMNYLDQIKQQRQDVYDSMQPSETKQAVSGVQKVRSADKLADQVTGGFGGAAGDLAAANLGGASSALAGSAISGAGSLGTTDVLGSLAGNAFLPTYSAASSAAGTSASGIFTSGAATTAATEGGVGGAASAGAALPAGLATATALPFLLAIGGMLGGIFGDDDFDPRTPQQKAQDTFDNSTKTINQLAQQQGVLPDQVTFGADKYNIGSFGTTLQDFMKQRYGSTPNGIYTQDQYQQAFDGSAQQGKPSLMGIASQLGNFLDNDPASKRGPQIPTSFDESYWRNVLKLRAKDRGKNPYDVDNMSTEDVFREAVNPVNSVQGQQLSGLPTSQTGALTTAQQLQAANIPDRILGFGGSNGFSDTVTSSTGTGGDPGSGSFLVAKANGGMIGTPAADPKGNKDNVPILASQGEYIIPKPVVDSLGQGFFDNLLAAFNVPSVAR